jgi:hypothetical protein
MSEDVCENCGKLKRSHREVNGELLCYPDTFPKEALIFRPSEWITEPKPDPQP